MGKRKAAGDDKPATATKMDVDGEDDSGSDDVKPAQRWHSQNCHLTLTPPL